MGRDGLIVGSSQALRPNFFLDGLLPERAPLVVQVSTDSGGSFKVAAVAGSSAESQRFTRLASQLGAQLLVSSRVASGSSSAAYGSIVTAVHRVRAAESGIPVACASPFGPSFVAGTNGRLIGRCENGGPQVLRQRLPALPARRTLFTRLGWMIGPASLLFLVVVAVVEYQLARDRARKDLATRDEGLGPDADDPPASRP
jgi:hypothetical protein